MLYKFKLGHNATKATKRICCAKSEGAVDHRIVTRWFKKFYLVCKNFNNLARSGSPKSKDSLAVLLTIKANLVSSILRVSGELGILLTSVVLLLHNLSKSIWSYWIVPHITKILKNFWWLVVRVLWQINFWRLFRAKSIFILNNQFYFKQFSLA